MMRTWISYIMTTEPKVAGKASPVGRATTLKEERNRRSGSLFGSHRSSVTVRDGVDLTAPILDDAMEAECDAPLAGCNRHRDRLQAGDL
jgi:hypothetical protein